MELNMDKVKSAAQAKSGNRQAESARNYTCLIPPNLSCIQERLLYPELIPIMSCVQHDTFTRFRNRRLHFEAAKSVLTLIDTHNELALTLVSAATIDGKTRARLETLREKIEQSIKFTLTSAMLTPKLRILEGVNDKLDWYRTRQFSIAGRFNTLAAYFHPTTSETSKNIGNQVETMAKCESVEQCEGRLISDILFELITVIEVAEFVECGNSVHKSKVDYDEDDLSVKVKIPKVALEKLTQTFLTTAELKASWKPKPNQPANIHNLVKSKRGKKKVYLETDSQKDLSSSQETVSSVDHKDEDYEPDLLSIPESSSRRTSRRKLYKSLEPKHLETQTTSKKVSMEKIKNQYFKETSTPSTSGTKIKPKDYEAKRKLSTESETPNKKKQLSKLSDGINKPARVKQELDTMEADIEETLNRAKPKGSELYHMVYCRLCPYAGFKMHKNFYRHVKRNHKEHVNTNIWDIIKEKSVDRETAKKMLTKWFPYALMLKNIG